MDSSPKGKCPAYSKAVFINVNPNILSGLLGTVKYETVWRPGKNIFTSYLTYKRVDNPFDKCKNKLGFGFTYARNNDDAPGNTEEDGSKVVSKPTLCSYLETNLNNDVSYKLCYNVMGNLWALFNGQTLEDWSKNKVSGSLEWADDDFNMQVSANRATRKSNELNVNFMKQFSNHWLLGGQCKFVAHQESPLPKVLKGYEGMLGYQQGSMTYAATLDQSLSTALRAIARTNSNNTTSMELKYDFREHNLKCSVSTHAVLTDKIEVKGQMYMDGKFGGNIIWKLMKKCTLTFSTMFNHYMECPSVGLDVNYKV